MSHSLREQVLRLAIPLTGGLTGSLLLVLVFFLIHASWPALTSIAPVRFLTDPGWHPTEGSFQLLPMLAGSLFVTIGAVAIGLPLGILLAGARVLRGPGLVRTAIGASTALLAAVPSVVLGLWGIEVVIPLVATLRPPGASLLAGILVLAAMIVPTVALVADGALSESVRRHDAAARALGLSPITAFLRVHLPAARSGLWAAVILGVARALGETMVVLMVCGNVAAVPGSLLDPVRTLTANIALEMAYALDTHRSVLFVGGLLLVIGVILLRWAPRALGALGPWFRSRSQSSAVELPPVSRDLPPLEAHLEPRSLRLDRLGGGVFTATACLAGALLLAIVGFLVAETEGLRIGFLFEAPRDSGREGGIGPILLSTLSVLSTTLSVVLPVGLGAAILLHLNRGRPGVRWLREALDGLSAVPSVVFGLFGLVFFAETLGLGVSVATGGLTLACMVLPLFVRTIEGALAALPEDLYRAGLSLGLTRERVMVRILLPAIRPALGGAITLSLGRALAETAAVLYTTGLVTRAPESWLDPGRVLSVHIYELAMQVPGGGPAAARSALVLLVVVLILHAATLAFLHRPLRGVLWSGRWAS